MKAVYIIFIFFVTTISVRAQTVLLHSDQKQESAIRNTTRGENLRRFSHPFIRLGEVASSDRAGARIIYGSSVDLSFGVRKKYKIGAVYSLGWEIEGIYTDYNLKQETGKVFPDTLKNKVERIDVSRLGVTFYNRINVDPARGNSIGKYIDIGINASLLDASHITKNDLPDGSKIKGVQTSLPYFNHFSSNVNVKLGTGHFVFYGSYRITNFIKNAYNYPELPRITAGIEVGLY